MNKRILLLLIGFMIFMNLFCGETQTKKDKDKDILATLVINGLTYNLKQSQAAANAAAAAGISCPSTAPTFSSLATAGTTSKCSVCHGTSGGFGGLDITNYDSTKARVTGTDPLNSKLYTKVASGGSMETNSNTAINEAIYCWIKGGALP